MRMLTIRSASSSVMTFAFRLSFHCSSFLIYSLISSAVLAKSLLIVLILGKTSVTACQKYLQSIGALPNLVQRSQQLHWLTAIVKPVNNDGSHPTELHQGHQQLLAFCQGQPTSHGISVCIPLPQISNNWIHVLAFAIARELSYEASENGGWIICHRSGAT